MAKAKAGSLREQCIAQAPKAGKTWIDKLEPKLSSEVKQIINEWVDYGEIRELYPSKRSLHRWLSTVPDVHVSRTAFTEYMLLQEQLR